MKMINRIKKYKRLIEIGLAVFAIFSTLYSFYSAVMEYKYEQ